MKLSKMHKMIQKSIRQNVPIVIFAIIISVVGLIVLFKLINKKTETVYVRAKVSQGLWWANTAKPSVWIAKSIQKGMVEKSLSGKPINEILSVRRYPWWNSEQYDVFVTLKLDVSKNDTTGKYTYKRAPLAVGSPIDMEFPEVQVGATVMEISEKPIQENFKDIIVTLDKKYAYSWEANGITIGDKYFDGEDTVLEVLNKEVEPAPEIYIRVAEEYPLTSDGRVNVKLTVRLRVEDYDGELIYREDQPVQLGRYLNAQTQSVVLQSYSISSIKAE